MTEATNETGRTRLFRGFAAKRHQLARALRVGASGKRSSRSRNPPATADLRTAKAPQGPMEGRVGGGSGGFVPDRQQYYAAGATRRAGAARGGDRDSSSMRRKRLLPWLVLLAVACAGPASDATAPNANSRPKNYIVLLEGRNFIFDYEGKPTRFGFSTTRHVEAANPEEAARLAIQDVRGDDRLNASLLNDPSDPPRVTTTRTVEVESFDSDPNPDLGYIFYEDHDTR
jgi:hypothetical protein